jgi:16S rRNA (cytidine1402-2'-O)-methyltransferase
MSLERDLAPGLYLVGTPIGNLEDITLRAIRVLKQADLIACEDTRQTQKLLNHFAIEKPTLSYHQHNEASRAQELLEELAQGARIALVSDAGMPGIADPGFRLLSLAIERGVPVVPVPGPAAFMTALVSSGLPLSRFHSVASCLPKAARDGVPWKSIANLRTLRSSTKPRIAFVRRSRTSS